MKFRVEEKICIESRKDSNTYYVKLLNQSYPLSDEIKFQISKESYDTLNVGEVYFLNSLKS